jgi:hypothetical protein
MFKNMQSKDGSIIIKPQQAMLQGKLWLPYFHVSVQFKRRSTSGSCMIRPSLMLKVKKLKCALNGYMMLSSLKAIN